MYIGDSHRQIGYQTFGKHFISGCGTHTFEKGNPLLIQTVL
jgi:hypothetical protein